MVVFDALVIVGMIIFYYWFKKKLTIFPKITLIFSIAFFISGCLYLIIISWVSLGITESDYSIDSVDKNVSYVYYDYTEDMINIRKFVKKSCIIRENRKGDFYEKNY